MVVAFHSQKRNAPQFKPSCLLCTGASPQYEGTSETRSKVKPHNSEPFWNVWSVWVGPTLWVSKKNRDFDDHFQHLDIHLASPTSFFFFFQHLHTVTLSAVKTPPGCTFLHSRSLGILSGPSLHYPGLSFLSEEFVGSLDGSLGWNGCTNLNRSGQLTNLSATPRSETLQSHLCRHSTNCTQDYQTSLSGQ